MDGERFDDLVKRFCTTRVTRLSALRGLAGGAVAALAGGLLAADELSAKGKKSRKGTKRQGGKRRQGPVNQGPQQQEPAGHCRHAGQPCEGAGNHDCCPGTVCQPGQPDTCVVCGGSDQTCCADFQCDNGLVCQNGHCVPNPGNCGDTDEPCCPGHVCNGANACDTSGGEPGICKPCGATGQPCCANDTCVINNICQNDICVVCGQAAGQPCCGNTCATGLTCNQQGICEDTTCGGENEPCCQPGNTCEVLLSCQNGTCKPCGAIGQPCCNGTCAVNATCVNGTCVATPPSPPPIQPCSLSNPCPTGSACSSSGQCVSTQGLKCRSAESPLQCCKRSVRKPCNRKGSNANAKRNCRNSGFRRCTNRFKGL